VIVQPRKAGEEYEVRTKGRLAALKGRLAALMGAEVSAVQMVAGEGNATTFQ
jgi:hypothetical protein